MGLRHLLPYFKRTENAVSGAAGRGTGGPLTVGPVRRPNDVLLASLDGAVQAGHRRVGDISGGLEEGFAPVDLNIVDGRHQSAAYAYLAPALNRPNLHVVTDATAYRLLFTGARCPGWNTAPPTERTRRRPPGMWSSPPGRSGPRSCCSSPASVPRRNSKGSASTS
jgi:choline dehydrogenase-like flavoprotein